MHYLFCAFQKICIKRKPPFAAAIFIRFLLIVVFTFLISDTATRFASGLTGSLAFTAAAVFRALAKVFGSQSFNGFHMFVLQ